MLTLDKLLRLYCSSDMATHKQSNGGGGGGDNDQGKYLSFCR